MAAWSDTCRSCGGSVAFAPETQTVACRACGWERGAGAAAAPEVGLGPSARCPGCGVALSARPERLAAPCPFCGTQFIRRARGLHREINAVIPMQMTEADARGELSTWLAEMPSAPVGIRNARIDQAAPLFLPFHKISVGNSQAREGRSWVARSACAQLGGFIGQGDILEDLWRQVPLTPWHPDYILGYDATRPQTSRADAVQGEVAQLTALSLHGSDYARAQGLLHFEHCLTVLAPVWLVRYRWRNQSHRAAVCGWSGRVLGHRPLEGVAGPILTGEFTGLTAQIAAPMTKFLVVVMILAAAWTGSGG
ncbi:MAG: hypothetical protein AAFR17_08225 [Pseudomonadota bacterium]